VEHSIFLAKVLGLYLLIVPAAVLLRRKQFAALAKELVANLAVVFLSGLVALILGLLIVVSHNVWTADWRAVITAIGWLTLAKGLIRIFLPEKLTTFGIDPASAKWTLASIVLLGLGIYLTYIGFSAGAAA
jgi:hypothetical protein